MSEQEFTDQLRHFRWQQPFIPFVVEMEDGEFLTIDYPSMAFREGFASLVDDTGELHFVAAAEVRSIRALVPEPQS